MQGAYSQSQLLQGKIPSHPISTVDLFAGALIPGMVLVLFYCLWQLILTFVKPEACPAVLKLNRKKNMIENFKIILLPIILIVTVLGSILAGIATPTEAASVGACGSMILSCIKKSFSINVLKKSMIETMSISSMIFLILIGAKLFSLVFIGLDGREMISAFMEKIPGGVFGSMFFIMVLIFLLGFFLDFIQIIYLIIPIIGPIILQMNIDPLWFGIMIAINLQTSFLTPPFGFALFYFRGVATYKIKTLDIYKGVIPFIIIQIIVLLLIAKFPQLATWLPNKIY